MSNRPPYSRIASYLSQPSSDQMVDGINKALKSGYGSFSQNSISIQNDANVEIKTIDIVVPSPWINITSFLNGWGNFGGAAPVAQYMRRYDGSVQMRGTISAGVIAASAFNLPVELAPHVGFQKAVVSNGLFGSLVVTSAGAVRPDIGSNVSFSLAIDFMPANNRCTPLSCFPINVKTRFPRPPAAVLAIKNTRMSQDGDCSPNVALMPSWRFIMSNGSPTVQILDIPGLEYGTRQIVDIMIIGGK